MTVAEIKDMTTAATFHNILLATDFSECSERAWVQALALATRENAHLFVMHALGPDLDVPVAPNVDPEAIVAEQHMRMLVVQDHEHRIEATNICRGNADAVIASLVAEKQIDLLVIGTHGRGGMTKLAMGSVAERLLRVAPCPVMTVGPRAVGTAAEFHTIIFATDFGKGSAKALPVAVSLAKEHGARLLLLHMMAPMPATSASLSAYAPPTCAADELTEWEVSSHKMMVERMKDWLPRDLKVRQEPEFVVGTDLLPEGILATATEQKADLIVMGANHTTSLWTAAHLPWSLVHEVVCQATCSVLTVAG